ncbi:MAG: hypothetical protein JWQ36_1016 [Enterovirga sp.]|jgi:hypothetical protein|nr:hypothetical protein [Enterovirga sp.]
MLQIENRFTAPVPKLDGRANLHGFRAPDSQRRIRAFAGLAALAGGVAGTALWLGFLAWCLVRAARLVVG